jgi:AcrR family transcriptional regulator
MNLGKLASARRANSMTGSRAPPGAHAGRPTKEQAEARHAELLDSALDHFLEKGFEPATIEAIANSVNMTKRTVYARYADKVALFRAAIRSAIDRLAILEAQLHGAVVADLEQTLINFAWLRVGRVMTPVGLKLQRIINAESYRVPDIFMTSYEIGALPTVNFLAALIAGETKAGRLAIAEPHMAANVFMSMVVSGPVRIIVSGNVLSPEEIDNRIRFAVRLFLDGARPR